MAKGAGFASARRRRLVRDLRRDGGRIQVMTAHAGSAVGVPLVAQIAFAGARRLFDPAEHPQVDAAAFHAAVAEHLQRRLERLARDLDLLPADLVCGVSSLAAGADILFAQACQRLGWRLRVFLPQPHEEFFRAMDPSGPHFTAEEAAAALAQLSGTHMIEEHVVATWPSRGTGFEVVNLELVREADLVVCMLRAGSEPRPGGTASMIDLARRHGRPCLVLTVNVGVDGRPAVVEQWHGRMSALARRQVPAPLSRMAPVAVDPSGVQGLCRAVLDFCGDRASDRRRRFASAAWFIVLTHVLATLCALWAVKSHGAAFVPWLLLFEITLLVTGVSFHHWLHRTHTAQEWAMGRLMAEISRSVLALVEVPGRLRHLFELPMPESLQALLRTWNVLHLRGATSIVRATWPARRDDYVRERLLETGCGQIPYYETQLRFACRRLMFANVVFFVGSLGALAATGAELAMVAAHGNEESTWVSTLSSGLGVLAVMLPVAAVAAVSLAAAFDLEARVHTCRDMLAFLSRQKQAIAGAATEHEFVSLAIDTESRLLGETVHWYARRIFTTVA